MLGTEPSGNPDSQEYFGVVQPVRASSPGSSSSFMQDSRLRSLAPQSDMHDDLPAGVNRAGNPMQMMNREQGIHSATSADGGHLPQVRSRRQSCASMSLDALDTS